MVRLGDPVTKGNMNTGTQYHQNVTRYEFGVSYDARYIRFEVTNWQFGDQKDLRIYQFMIFYDAGEVPAKQDAPEGAGVPHQPKIGISTLPADRLQSWNGDLPCPAGLRAAAYGRGIPTAEESEQFGYDGPLFYDLILRTRTTCCIIRMRYGELQKLRLAETTWLPRRTCGILVPES